MREIKVLTMGILGIVKKNKVYSSKGLLLLLTCMISACSFDKGEDHDYEIIHLEEYENVVDEFDTYFFNKNEIKLFSGTKSEIDSILPAINKLEVNSQGDIAIPSFSTNQIMLFDSTGKKIKVIGQGEGRGPGEFEALTTIELDNNDYLWAYDPSLMRMSIFSPPDYEFTETFDTKLRFADFLVTDSQSTILYTFHNTESEDDNLLLKFNKKGELLETGLEGGDKSLRIFLGRYQGGGLSKGFVENRFFIVYPGEFGIFKFGLDLDIISKIETRDSDITNFRSSPPPFPSHLDPYDYTDSHANWWYSFFHISRLYVVEPNFLILTWYEQTGSREWAFYLSIYDTEGSVIVEGLPLPVETRVVGTWKNKVFLARNEQMLSDGTILPLKLTSYEIKHNVEN